MNKPLKVVPLISKTKKEKNQDDREFRIFFHKLVKSHRKGEIETMCAVYFSPNGECFTIIPSNMKLSQLSYAIHCLQNEMHRHINE